MLASAGLLLIGMTTVLNKMLIGINGARR